MAHTVHKIGIAHTWHATSAENSNGTMTLFFVFIVFAIYIFINRKSPSRRGRKAENFVSSNLLELNPARYKILNDVMLPSRGNSATTQIDHIVVSNYGIFCIETKAHKGWIFGNANQDYWTQVIFRYKGRFYNPLRQNFAHVKAIEDVLGKWRLKRSIVSLVIFPNADKLKISGTDSVGYPEDIEIKIGSYLETVYSDAERDAFYNLLATSNILDEKLIRALQKKVKSGEQHQWFVSDYEKVTTLPFKKIWHKLDHPLDE